MNKNNDCRGPAIETNLDSWLEAIKRLYVGHRPDGPAIETKPYFWQQVENNAKK